MSVDDQAGAGRVITLMPLSQWQIAEANRQAYERRQALRDQFESVDCWPMTLHPFERAFTGSADYANLRVQEAWLDFMKRAAAKESRFP